LPPTSTSEIGVVPFISQMEAWAAVLPGNVGFAVAVVIAGAPVRLDPVAPPLRHERSCHDN
jgi:hypothetical protein